VGPFWADLLCCQSAFRPAGGGWDRGVYSAHGPANAANGADASATHPNPNRRPAGHPAGAAPQLLLLRGAAHCLRHHFVDSTLALPHPGGGGPLLETALLGVAALRLTGGVVPARAWPHPVLLAGCARPCRPLCLLDTPLNRAALRTRRARFMRRAAQPQPPRHAADVAAPSRYLTPTPTTPPSSGGTSGRRACSTSSPSTAP
jgi:hypothetical protein